MTKYTIEPYDKYDKEIRIDCDGITVKVDSDDVPFNKAVKLAKLIARIPDLLETEWMYKDLSK